MSQQSSEQVLESIKQQADGLSADDQLRLVAYLVERARSLLPASQTGRKWQDLRGLYAHPALGEDAQEWVSRTRKDADNGRTP